MTLFVRKVKMTATEALLIVILAGVNRGICSTPPAGIRLLFYAEWDSVSMGTALNNPSGISAGPDGSVYIADTGNNRVVKLSPGGKFVRDQGGFGWEEKEFDSPVCVCAVNGLDVFVSDYYNNRIQRFDKDLNYIATLSSAADTDEGMHFGFPRGLDLSSQGELFCVDGENKRVIKFDVAGRPLLEFGGFSAGDGRLSSPWHILVSSRNHVLVSDEDMTGIRVFDIHGNFICILGDTFLAGPAGLAQTKEGAIAVIGRQSKTLALISPDYAERKIAALSEYTDHASCDPVDIACRGNRLFILDSGRSVVYVFTYTR